jgi:CRISPR type I-E-associated protein CasB/Cse2
MARKTLAELRQGANFSPRSRLRMVKHVVPFLEERPDPDDEWFYVVAALFATHRSPLLAVFLEHLRGRGLGAALREIQETSGSVEGRLLTLVNSGPSTLPVHLRRVVSLLSSKEIALDWYVLLGDLLEWKHPRRIVQERWLREFYGAPTPPAGASEWSETTQALSTEAIFEDDDTQHEGGVQDER